MYAITLDGTKLGDEALDRIVAAAGGNLDHDEQSALRYELLGPVALYRTKRTQAARARKKRMRAAANFKRSFERIKKDEYLRHHVEGIDADRLVMDAASRHPEPFDARAPEVSAFELLVGRLGYVFENRFKLNVSYSRDKLGEPRGPFIDFAEAVLIEFKIRRSRRTIANAISRAGVVAMMDRLDD
jgi:hypothetical protein